MSVVQEIFEELRAKGTEKTRITYGRHGLPTERTFGVSIADLKIVEKRIKGQQDVAIGLFATGFMEPMYLGGLVARGNLMSREQIQQWAEDAADMPMISDYPVAWVTQENCDGKALALDWIRSSEAYLSATGWGTYSGILEITDDRNLDLDEIRGLLAAIPGKVHDAPNRVKQKMNSFVITVGTAVSALHAEAKATAASIGAVSVDVGDTACKIAVASEAIAKVELAGRLGRKRKTMRC